ncbi:TPA: hypothetical protein U1C15_000116 [Streptococcus suis]|nr:hypothetical protein [Streptococcus suis]
MTFLRFHDLVHAISQTCKASSSSSKWTKQEAIINFIFHTLDIHNSPYSTDQDDYVSSSACSKYGNAKKNIPKWARKQLLLADWETLQEKLVHTIAASHHFPSKDVAKKLYFLAQEKPISQSDCYPELETSNFVAIKTRAEKFYSQEKYTHYIAATILFSLIHIPNVPSCQQEESSLLDSLHFNQDLEEAIQQGRYYLSYERDIIIHPDRKKKEFKVLVKRLFTSHYPNPVHPHKDKFLLNTFYSTPTLRSNNHFISLKINQIDYSDRVQVLDEDLDIETHRFPYKRSLLVENLPASDLYQIDLQTKYFASFPIRFGSFRLHSPAKRFKVTVRIRTNEKRKLCLTLKNFGSFNKQISNIDRIEPNATMAYFENIDWTFPSSGYAYIVKPWDEFWQDFLPQSQQKSAED